MYLAECQATILIFYRSCFRFTIQDPVGMSDITEVGGEIEGSQAAIAFFSFYINSIQKAPHLKKAVKPKHCVELLFSNKNNYGI